jgi:hypothetical protein
MNRADVVAEALTWLHTPYEINQCVKGAGADCGRWIFDVLDKCGLVDANASAKAIEIFGNDWSCHTDDQKYQRYIFRMLRNARQILRGISSPAQKILPACIVLVKTQSGRVADHGALVTHWPWALHAVPDYGVSEFNATTHWLWAHREIEAFDPFGGDHI